MNLFPFFTDISGKTFLIVGGGGSVMGEVLILLCYLFVFIVVCVNFVYRKKEI